MLTRLYPRLRLQISFADLIFSLFSGILKQDSQPPPILKQFQQGNKQVLVTLSVRTAFDLLLQALNLPPGSEVLMSAVNIRDMGEIVRRHGLVLVPVEIDFATLKPDIQQLEALISPQSKILLVAHLFGAVIDIKPLIEVCQKHQILVIEDCAQAFCGESYCGDPQADVSLFSFGPIKSCTALGSAIASIKDSTLAEQIRQIEASYPQRSELWFYRRVLKYCGLKFLSLPVIYQQLIAILLKLKLDPDSTINALTRGFSGGDLMTKIRYRPPQGMRQLLWHRLRSFDNLWFKIREAKARLLIANLSPEIVYPGNQTDFHSFWVFPILTDNPDWLIQKLRENGFDATRGNTSLTHFHPHFENSGHYLTPEHLSEKIVYLPLSEALPDEEIVRLAQIVNSFLCKPIPA
ncbi:MAG: aminotransferase class V-fold PLP-dependent enzyme [Desertifilum sp.]|nr:aminotransferase class V-fold PLP-dependent enzyme [Desertifilum sp.]